ncbi:MAG TPA: PVC-type heme-binding CxxCH protein [Bryobacteraceae bacterium]|nr:PVC-type heme-binding CxxCH protein [Bryobacteraceae bacterium]
MPGVPFISSRKYWYVVLLCAAILTGCRKSGPPYSVDDALKTFKVESGFHVEKFVSEPAVESPVAMDIDENGRIYVVEDRGYPLSTDNPLGRVKLLEDTNGDGIPDRVTIFADKLVMPTGVMRWKKGILVTDVPNVWYFEDTNGDGKADVRKLVLTGFAVTNPQHTVNNPIYGLDNWIYLAHEGPATAIIYKKQFGDRGSDIRFPDRPDVPALKEHNRNVRFRPDSYQLEARSGSSQYGHTFDDWGHHFTTNNSDHAREEVIAARYLERNPDLPVSSAMQQIPDHGAAAKVYPITLHPRFELLTEVGQFTSACGITCYRGSLFVAEPVHALVHQDLISESGATFVARRAHPDVEFLASTDAWFRPVNFYVGPDGALYVMDFYRLVIEHPEWMSTEAQKSKDLTKGIDRGRIYRIVPDGAPAPKPVKLGAASNSELVQELANPVIWWRRTAQRLLVDHKAVDVAPELVRMLHESPSPVGRLHALWTLDGLGKLEAPEIEMALKDREPGVRENAIVLAELHMATSPALAQKLLGMVKDPDSRVRCQLLCTLGSLNSPAARAARDELLSHDVEDRWFQIAALSASSGEAPRIYEKAVTGGTTETPGRVSFVRQAASVVGARHKPAEVQSVLIRVARNTESSASWWRAASLEGLALGLKGRATGPEVFGSGQPALLKLFDSPDAPVRSAALRLIEMSGLPPGAASASALQHAATIAGDHHSDAGLRADAIGLLAIAGPQTHEALLKPLIDPQEPDPVQAAAVRAFGKIKGDDVGKYLLTKWRALTPAGRTQAADAMYLEPSRVRLLVAALKAGDVQPWTLNFSQRRRLIMNNDPSIRDEARPLLEPAASDREKVVKRYEVAFDRTADASRGREVFKSICVKCHRFAGLGVQVGPDLATVQNQPKQALLEDILMPNKTIAQGYEAYVVETTGGTFDGVVGAQTPTTIALRHEDGKEDIIQRKDIKQMYVTNVSAMPGDLEKQIDIQQMADLLEFLKTTH